MSSPGADAVLTPERWQTVKRLLDDALQHPPEARAAFLEHACGGDAPLRREIESLLAVDHEVHGFLEPPAVRAGAGPELRERLQTALGAAYRIERELGRGGMSTVFLAHDVRHQRPVAVKVLHDGATTMAGVQRFQREIEVLARLQHPNILPLHDSGAVDGSLYYLMPFVEGESLRARLEREPQLPIDEALRIACEVADALGYAHAHGIVHRDIKPENILLSAGHAIVADFGIGKVMSAPDDEALTWSGSFIGTPAYASTEQAAGRQDLDGRSDLYSLGVVLYEMLAGAPPFSGATPQAVVRQRLTEPLPPLRASRTTVPEFVERAVLRLLAESPADRFGTAAELIRALATPSPDAENGSFAPGRTQPGSAGRGAAHRSAAAVPSILVLPFANMSADADDEYFADGMTEELINALTRLRAIRVVARTTAFSFKGVAKDIRAIARRLAVSRVLEGSVRRAGNRLRIAAELIDGTDGCRIWAEQFDRQVDDIFAVQDELTRRIVASLEGPLLDAAVDARVTPRTTSAAYELYLRGRFSCHRRTEQGLRRGIEHFEAATGRDPRFAPAYAGLADAHALRCVYGLHPPADGMPRARAAALAALRLDESLAEAHATLGCVEALYDWNWTAAERHFRHAVALNPQHPAPHHRYALDCLAPLGRFAEASAELDQARARDPLSLIINASIGVPLHLARRYDDAAAAYLAACDLDPSFGVPYHFLGQVRVQQRRHPEAIAAFEKAIELSGPSTELRAALGHAYGVAGDGDRARAIRAELLRERETRWVSPCLIAQIHLALDERESALDWLERACEERAADLVWLNVRPVYDPVRMDARFRALLAHVGRDT